MTLVLGAWRPGGWWRLTQAVGVHRVEDLGGENHRGITINAHAMLSIVKLGLTTGIK